MRSSGEHLIKAHVRLGNPYLLAFGYLSYSVAAQATPMCINIFCFLLETTILLRWRGTIRNCTFGFESFEHFLIFGQIFDRLLTRVSQERRNTINTVYSIQALRQIEEKYKKLEELRVSISYPRFS